MLLRWGFVSLKRLMGFRFLRCVCRFVWERLAEMKRRVPEYGSVRRFEEERSPKARRKFWMSLNVHAVRDDNGAFLCFEGTEQNITQRKHAESVLRESERKLRLIAENT